MGLGAAGANEWLGVGGGLLGAAVDSDACGGAAAPTDSSLITPAIDMSGFGAGSELVFDLGLNALAATTFSVESSTDGGGTWTELESWAGEDVGHPDDPSTPVTLDVGSLAGESAVNFRFRYQAGWDWWVYVDNVELVDLVASDDVSVEIEGLGGAYAQSENDRGTETVSFVYDNVDGSIDQIFNVFTIEQDGSEIDGPTYSELFDSLSYDDYIRGLSGTTVDNVVGPETRNVDLSFQMAATAPPDEYTLVITSYDVTGIPPESVSLGDVGTYDVLDEDMATVFVLGGLPEDITVDIAGEGNEPTDPVCGDDPTTWQNIQIDLQEDSATVWSVAWDLNLVTGNGAWASEAVLVFGSASERDQLFLTPGIMDDIEVPGGVNYSGGPLDLIDAGLAPIQTDTDGMLYVSFCRTYEPGSHEWQADSELLLNSIARPMGVGSVTGTSLRAELSSDGVKSAR